MVPGLTNLAIPSPPEPRLPWPAQVNCRAAPPDHRSVAGQPETGEHMRRRDTREHQRPGVVLARYPVTVLAALVLALSVAGGCSRGGPASRSGPVNPVSVENAQAGTLTWRLTEKTTDDIAKQIAGYASATSVNIGEEITFQVTVNPAQDYSIDIYRMGYYQGLGGRLMRHVQDVPGIHQPDCPMDHLTGLVACGWAPGYRLTIPPGWTSGVYLAKLTNAAGFASYIIFTVRDDARHADLLYQQSVTTYQAYNAWPRDTPGASGHPATGKSLYEDGSSLAPIGLGPPRAVMVSFDRPYAKNNGAGDFLDWEFYYLRWLEKSGYDVAYSTDLDTHRNGRILRNYKGFLSVGHDEYWTREMYDNVTAARDAGVNVGFFGADAVYWQIRMAPSAAGVPDRIQVCYKDAALDPVKGPTSTVLWRDPPAARPEQQLIGVQFTSAQPSESAPAAFVPAGVENSLYHGSGATAATPSGHVVGYEADRQFSGSPLPDSVPGTYALLSDSPYLNDDGRIDHQNSVIYQARSGAWVFGAGSIEWSWGLYDDARHHEADPVIQRVTANVLDRFVRPAQP
ncbi:N,N-dimethylformamidase beta subunit family domain-containing protein [Amycolatopsis thermophila]|uniref:N,N-dimethylformamidase beta subunit-like C-terminal domain-containing protein n=1 Tax=Amycolatopsis thermophila TaxID=206084 RepID=A0ABU0F2C3_9PSEU|nr:N,N-dimethylformamidase beta subunit family domain-containing protein [Amycolatopsis thermophila]MDQ0381548.1 hypothetical protein [Amycolatopsis thermophila]